MANVNLMRWSGVEVFNTERLAAYLRNGIAPQGATFDPEVCGGLAEVVYGNTYTPYVSPIQDEPPWFDVANPDTWDFAGLLPLEVTGLEDSTRTVQVIPTLSGDGIPGRVSRGPRTVGVTAVLVGRTTEAVYAGLAWLQRVLHGECDADEHPCGPSGTLEFFTTCGCTGPVPDLEADRIEEEYYGPTNLDPAGDPADWSVINGDFNTPYDVDRELGTILVPYDPSGVLDGGESDDDSDEIVDGGGAGGTPLFLDGGDAAPVYATATVMAGPYRPCIDSPVTITATVYLATDGGVPVIVQPVVVDESGTVLDAGPKVDVTDDADPDPTIITWELPFGVGGENWRPGLISDGTVAVFSIKVQTYPELEPSEVLDPYRRYLPTTTTTAGPTVVDVVDTGCVTLLTVEWVWVSGSPYRYGATENVLTGLGWGVAPSFVAPGVTYEDGGGSPIAATPWNCAPLAPVASCAIDPLAPTFGTPPAAPSIVDPLRPRITTQNIRSVWGNIGPEQTPANEGVLSVDLVTGVKPVVGARVRVYDTADAAGTIPDLCDFVYEFLIDYIPADSTLTIDGPSGGIITTCAGNPEPQDSAAGVRGAYGGPIVEPVVRCDRRYLVFVQWLNVYPRTAVGFYTSGDTQGTLFTNLYVTDREG